MQKVFGIIASVYGALAVMLGAFGAHALKDKLDEYQHSIYEKAVSYQFYHLAGLLAVVFLYSRTDSNTLKYSGWCFSTGILLFSGSLYLLALRQLLGLETLTPVLGPVTPLGGLCFIAGWTLLAVSFARS